MAAGKEEPTYVVRSRYGVREFWDEASNARYVRWVGFRISCEFRWLWAARWWALPVIWVMYHGRRR